jgi:hypothetical protein
LIHGTVDTDVPYEQSVLMADQLRKFGVDHALLTIRGGEHDRRAGSQEIDRLRTDVSLRAAMDGREIDPWARTYVRNALVRRAFGA